MGKKSKEVNSSKILPTPRMKCRRSDRPSSMALCVGIRSFYGERPSLYIIDTGNGVIELPTGLVTTFYARVTKQKRIFGWLEAEPEPAKTPSPPPPPPAKKPTYRRAPSSGFTGGPVSVYAIASTTSPNTWWQAGVYRGWGQLFLASTWPLRTMAQAMRDKITAEFGFSHDEIRVVQLTLQPPAGGW